jgi:hypothetical protein
MSVSQATSEAEIGRITVWGQPRQKVSENRTHLNQQGECGGLHYNPS